MILARLLWIFFQLIVGYNLVLPLVIYLLSLFKSNISPPAEITEGDYGIIVTAYEQVTHIPAVVQSLLNLNYQNYLIYVVADNCEESELSFTDDRVIVLRPETILAGNTRSHFYAIRNFKRKHNRLTIIDSDNLVDAEYLNELNRFFNQGYIAVQGVREAKNLNTIYACLDAARDIYYHFYDGKILFKAGSSATLAGSGMAFTTDLYIDCLGQKDVTGAGFDKVLQAEIVGRNVRIAFAGGAIVYDEKTSQTDQLVNQRSRWINTWFKYFSLGFTLIKKGVTKQSWNQFLFGVVLLRPPLFIFLLMGIICLIINLFVSVTGTVLWIAGFLLFIGGFYLALLKSDTDKRIYRSLINIPRFIFFQVLSLLKARKANQRSVATKHYHNDIADQE
ncbi:glycosyltransferase [Mucilaginibacter sp. UR6-11]|uniref:glycosyltransferase n=1 Tax=Mucilaginibacter sp. UR6-11 TaxID=1435644 RepID=UPI001E64833A|nr:glycosyltransferase [Mucilaginibacter sp. UR6-11]MCC8423772.1 glycosyltransferase family 2 protein [Mucilaginibacter sp. UR6-11]